MTGRGPAADAGAQRSARLWAPLVRLGRVAVVAGTLAAACAAPPPEDRITFRVPRRLSAVVAHIAQADGIFQQAGLEVEVIPWDRGSTVIPSLVQGSLDVSATSPSLTAYINTIQRGGRIRLVAARTVHDPEGCGYFSLAARNELLDSGRLTDLASVRGLRIATDRTASSYYYWYRLLRTAGLTFDDVRIIDVPTTAKPAAIASDEVDVSSQSEPWTTRIVATGEGRVWRSLAEFLPGHQSTFMVFGSRLLDERRDLGSRFLEAYLRAVRQYLHQGKSEHHLRIVARETRISEDELRRMCWPQVVPDGRIDPRGLMEYQAWALEEGMIAAISPASELVDSGFLDGLAVGSRQAGGSATP